MKAINTRTRIEVRWSTNMALVGYADNADQRAAEEKAFLESKPDFIGTARQVAEYWRGVKQNLGGVYVRCALRTRTTQEKVSWDEINLLNAHF